MNFFVSFFFFCVNERMMHIVVKTLRKRKFNALVRWNVMLLLIHKKHLIPFSLQRIYFHIYYIYLCISVMYPSNMKMQTFIKSHVDIKRDMEKKNLTPEKLMLPEKEIFYVMCYFKRKRGNNNNNYKKQTVWKYD